MICCVLDFLCHFSLFPYPEGVVDIQIIGWSKSVCLITDAKDTLRKFWIL